MLVISWFICGLMYGFLYLYLHSTLICRKKFTWNSRKIAGLAIMAIIGVILMSLKIEYLKPYLMHLASFVLLLFVYREKFIKTVISLLSIAFLSFVAEFIIGLVVILIMNINLNNSNNSPIIYLVINTSIFVITILLGKFRFTKSIVNFIMDWYNKNEYISLMIFTFCAFTISIFLLYNNFINILPKSLLWFTNIFCLAVFVFIVGFFKEKTTKNKLIYEYDQLMEYIKTYEALLDEKNKNQHEYKNQLAVIRVMVKDKKTLEYIDSLLHNETEEDLETINKLKYIPKGGLKGLIYYKIDSMKKKKIKTYINVSSELRSSKLWKTCDNNLQQISKVLGVYLDNAIEAAELTKEKMITIDVYLDDNSIVFEITNSFTGTIDIEKIGDKGYSTKGSGHGYGLALVNDIITKSDYLNQNREINGNYYIQRLYIKSITK